MWPLGFIVKVSLSLQNILPCFLSLVEGDAYVNVTGQSLTCFLFWMQTTLLHMLGMGGEGVTTKASG